MLAALGSSAVASNVISGVMLIHTREFREGDRVKRNELVSVPNAMVIGSSVVNFSQAEREISQPVALSTSLSRGYDVPWREVYALLIAAAGIEIMSPSYQVLRAGVESTIPKRRNAPDRFSGPEART